MLTRRNAIRLAVLAAATATTGARAADATARDFLAAIYDAYKGKDSKGIPLDTDATVQRYFEPGLAALIIKDQKAAAARGEVGTLDGDPFVDAQDWQIETVAIAVRDTGPDKAQGTATFQNLGKPTTVTFDLVKRSGNWRIADIAWQRDGKTQSLRALFAKK